MTVHTREGLRMSKREAEGVDAAVEVLTAAGVAYDLERGGKHLCIQVGGHKIVISSTPRTDNHQNWARQRARSLLRKLGSTHVSR